MSLPEELDDQLWQEVQAIDKENHMEVMNSFEKKWLADGIKKGEAIGEARAEARFRASLESSIRTILQLKFGADVAASLMPRVQSLPLAKLEQIAGALDAAASPEAVRQMLTHAG